MLFILCALILCSCNDKSAKCEHRMVLMPEVLPSCSAGGHSAYYRCETCNNTYQDPKGIWPISAAELSTAPAGHSFSPLWDHNEQTHWHPAACTHTDLKNGLEPHSFCEWEIIIPADCSKNGLTQRSCVCGALEEKVIPRRLHTFSDHLTYDGDHHWYAATCLHAGEVSGKEAHIWSDWQITSEATCGSAGEMIRRCDCGASQKISTDPLPHTYAEELSYDGDHHWYAASCEHDARSGLSEHEWDSGSITLLPGCETDGEIKYSCACGASKLEPIDAHGHNYAEDWSYDADGHWHASTCGHTDKIDNYQPHAFGEWRITLQPTCGSEGAKLRSCVCGSKEQAAVDALPHAFDAQMLYDTDTHWRISVCEHRVTDGPYPHDWSEWKTVIPADCELEGERSRSCLCGACQEDVINATGHSYSTNWSTNETHHWRNANCAHTDLRKELGKHEYGNDYICSTCSYRITERLSYDLLMEDDSYYYTVIGRGAVVGGSIVIPSEIDGIPVLYIADGAFENDDGLTELTIPESIKEIGGNAFAECLNLAVINFNAVDMSDLAAENGVFKKVGLNCGTRVIIGNKVKHIPANLFAPDIIEMTVAASVLGVNEVIFEDTSTCQSIGEKAFASCGRLDRITIPESVTRIGGNAFIHMGLISGSKSVILNNKDGWYATFDEGIESSDERIPINPALSDEEIARLMTEEYARYTWKVESE